MPANRSFEHEQLAEHLRFATRAVAAARAQHTQIRLTCLAEASRPITDRMCEDFAAQSGVEVVEDRDRTTGRGYYTSVCFKIYIRVEDRCLEVADGGFVDWSQLLTGNRKERLLISGFGVDRLSETLASPPRHDQPPPK